VDGPPYADPTGPINVESSTILPKHGKRAVYRHNGARLGKTFSQKFSGWSWALTYVSQDLWDKTFTNTNLADGNTPPDLWDFDVNFGLQDPNINFMQWDLQV
jgi:hypothetical protein